MNSRGEFFTRLVKINSNLEVNLAEMHRACVCPRSLDLAFRIFMLVMQLIPMPSEVNYAQFIIVHVCHLYTQIDLRIIVGYPQNP